MKNNVVRLILFNVNDFQPHRMARGGGGWESSNNMRQDESKKL